MSTITVTNIKSTGDTNSRPVTAIASAWVNFNGFTETIRDTFNAASITDNALGDYTINFIANMADTNYALVGMCSSGNNNLADYGEFVQMKDNATKTVGVCQIGTNTVTPSSSGVSDKTNIYVVFFGDLT